ncbi:hypothetical protein LY76DRAFT_84802 [Colletotrichum caudatum]|nr:hypothetical protein LY76DRAFT_84802 [Colletotrichum caudatum]
MEEATALANLALPQTNIEPISRPSSTSTSESASASLPQLPGISALAQANSATSSPQMRDSRDRSRRIHTDTGASASARSRACACVCACPSACSRADSDLRLWRRFHHGMSVPFLSFPWRANPGNALEHTPNAHDSCNSPYRVSVSVG